VPRATAAPPPRPFQAETWPLARITAYPRNAREHSPAQIRQIADSIRAFGWTTPVLVTPDGTLIAGHGRLAAAQSLGMAEVPVVILAGLSEQQQRLLRLADNRLALGATWNEETLTAELRELQVEGADLGLTGFDADELEAFFPASPPPVGGGDVDEGRGAELRAKWGTATGQLWAIGRHRLICGDATDTATVERVRDGQRFDVMLTDPPYCSGGFQESGRSSGSVGTDRENVKMIANDTLSTRGYMALLKAVVGLADPGAAYVFTDWRMWVNLFDVMESSGFGVRNMIVWDKGTPGMGVGWRAQHELIMFATKIKPAFDNHKAQGNVIQSQRTGNVHHTTEKPVDLLEAVLRVSDFARVLVDPFTGSGSTFVAAERTGRTICGLELDPEYVAATLERLADMGLKPERAG